MRALTLACAGLAAVVAFPATASAATAHWRLDYRITQPNFQPVGITAVSAKEAWATGGGEGGYGLLRWNGRTWHKASLPRSLNGTSPTQLTASAHGNVWLGGTAPDGLYNTRNYVIRWDGKRWGSPIMLPGPLSIPLVSLQATGSSGVWTFTESGKASYYDGHRWTTRNLGFQVGQTQLVKQSVWTLGITSSAQPRVAVSNGTRFSNVALPAVARGKATFLDGITATGSTVWVGGSVHGKSLLLRRNKSSWTRVSAPGLGVGAIASDGSGGLWAQVWTGAESTGLYHYSHGAWKPVRISGVHSDPSPLLFAGITTVPGGTTVLAIGGHRDPKEFSDAAIYAYRR
jgi:hypothetical protein